MDHGALIRDEYAAAGLFESGQVQEATAVWPTMASDPELPFPDRVRNLKNLAHGFTRMGHLAHAEAALDEGIAIEDRLVRGFMRESKAVWLVEQGRVPEAIAIYEGLLRQFWMDSASIKRCQDNIARLKS